MALVAAGCSTPGFLCLAPTATARAAIATAPDANADTAVAVDIVYARDAVLAGQIRDLDARAWFASRTQRARDWPDALVVRSWELAPGQTVAVTPLDPPCGVETTLAFADYASPGAHRLVLDDTAEARIRLLRDDLELSP